MIYDEFQNKVGFKKIPVLVGDSGLAFMSFLAFATGDSAVARSLRFQFSKTQTSKAATEQETAAAFVDWLIATQWGEAEQVDVPFSDKVAA